MTADSHISSVKLMCYKHVCVVLVQVCSCRLFLSMKLHPRNQVPLNDEDSEYDIF